MSVDMRLMFCYHVDDGADGDGGSLDRSTGAFNRRGFSGRNLLVSRHYRQKKHWRWPGIKPLDVVYAVGGIVLISFFLYSATPPFPPTNNHFLPWYLAGLGIGLFGILQSLKIVHSSQADFIGQCRTIDQYGREVEPPPPPVRAQGTEPTWKGATKVVNTIVFMLVWVAGVAWFSQRP